MKHDIRNIALLGLTAAALSLAIKAYLGNNNSILAIVFICLPLAIEMFIFMGYSDDEL